MFDDEFNQIDSSQFQFSPSQSQTFQTAPSVKPAIEKKKMNEPEKQEVQTFKSQELEDAKPGPSYPMPSPTQQKILKIRGALIFHNCLCLYLINPRAWYTFRRMGSIALFFCSPRNFMNYYISYVKRSRSLVGGGGLRPHPLTARSPEMYY